MNLSSDLIEVKEILENAEIFEVCFYDEKFFKISVFQKPKIKFDNDYLEFSANKIAKNFSQILRKKLIETFFPDVEKGGKIARCFVPHHGIKAIYENTTVEIAICYKCSLYRGQVPDKIFGGSFPGAKSSKSKKIFDEIIEKYGVDVQ